MRFCALRDDHWDCIKVYCPVNDGIGAYGQGQSPVWMLFYIGIAPGFYEEICRSILGILNAIHTRYTGWSQKGVWKKVFEPLSQGADNEHLMIDSTVVRARRL